MGGSLMPMEILRIYENLHKILINHHNPNQVRDLKLYLEGSAPKPSRAPQRGALFAAAVRQGLQGAGATLATAVGEADPVLAAELMKPRRARS